MIIFDFDGTLAETEIIASEVISTTLAAQGVNVQADEITARSPKVERDDQQPRLESNLGVSLPENFMEIVGVEIQLAASANRSATPGAIELLQWLTIPFCAASNTSRFELIHRMRSANLLGFVSSRFLSSDETVSASQTPPCCS
ncbi:beta-phosphoglucomutase-like phosphatase (HAD superfamily) [Rhizobium mongolense]|uniref:Beta-phosphoglucomutase-like phosphatase (HAD superfamily) n=1 Tax=Rhizobium mongolense TaxID=57676 RepID=A0ABR6IYD9_9HYPH|nr:HAD family hydrolase [Rhizobium mongolense]MBB4232548.1 beta-phosphoglucomutase-like phosphatase (HAD superfamily) [Rhizobium mongolense]